MITEPSPGLVGSITTATVSAGHRVISRLITDLEGRFRRIVAYQARKMNVDADDLYQEAIMRILKQSRVDPDHEALIGWLDRCVKFTAVDLKRRTRHDIPTDELPDTIAPEATPEQQALQHELVERIGSLLRTLPQRQRDILLMRILYGMSADETSTVIGISPAAVRVAQYRALNQLRRVVNVANRLKADEKVDDAREKIRAWGTAVRPGEEWSAQAWHALGHALHCAWEAVDRDPDYQRPWTILADIYHLIGKASLAHRCLLASYERATAGPNHPGQFYKVITTRIDSGYPFDAAGGLRREDAPRWFEDKYQRHWTLPEEPGMATPTGGDAKPAALTPSDEVGRSNSVEVRLDVEMRASLRLEG